MSLVFLYGIFCKSNKKKIVNFFYQDGVVLYTIDKDEIRRDKTLQVLRKS